MVFVKKRHQRDRFKFRVEVLQGRKLRILWLEVRAVLQLLLLLLRRLLYIFDYGLKYFVFILKVFQLLAQIVVFFKVTLLLLHEGFSLFLPVVFIIDGNGMLQRGVVSTRACVLYVRCVLRSVRFLRNYRPVERVFVLFMTVRKLLSMIENLDFRFIAFYSSTWSRVISWKRGLLKARSVVIFTFNFCLLILRYFSIRLWKIED